MSDHDQIRAVIQTYFDCMSESSADKAREAFHPNARITGYLPDGLHEMSTEEFAGFVADQQPSPSAQGQTLLAEVLSVETAGDTGVAKVRDAYLGMTFHDILSLLKVDGRWTIYNKLFHVEA